MAKASGPKPDVSLARATGAFYQAVSRMLEDDHAATLDAETYDAITAFEDSLKTFEDFIYTRRHSIFFKNRMVMFNGNDCH